MCLWAVAAVAAVVATGALVGGRATLFPLVVGRQIDTPSIFHYEPGIKGVARTTVDGSLYTEPKCQWLRIVKIGGKSGEGNHGPWA